MREYNDVFLNFLIVKFDLADGFGKAHRDTVIAIRLICITHRATDRDSLILNSHKIIASINEDSCRMS